MHILITGTTGSGKSVFARRLCKAQYKKKRGVIVYDPYKSRWQADYIETDFDVFYERVINSENCFVVVDESGDIGRYNKELESLATQGRHYGHDIVFITQRIQQMSVTIRENCGRLFMFRSSVKAGMILSEQWISEELLNAHTLGVGEYYDVKAMEKAIKKRSVYNE